MVHTELHRPSPYRSETKGGQDPKGLDHLMSARSILHRIGGTMKILFTHPTRHLAISAPSSNSQSRVIRLVPSLAVRARRSEMTDNREHALDPTHPAGPDTVPPTKWGQVPQGVRHHFISSAGIRCRSKLQQIRIRDASHPSSAQERYSHEWFPCPVYSSGASKTKSRSLTRRPQGSRHGGRRRYSSRHNYRNLTVDALQLASFLNTNAHNSSYRAVICGDRNKHF